MKFFFVLAKFAINMTNYKNMNCKQLKELCKERRISNYSKLNKQGLIDLLAGSEAPAAKFEENFDLADGLDMTSLTEDILSVNYWKNTDRFKAIKEKETQTKYYQKMNASPEVLELVELESKPFGSEAESIISEIFKLGPRTSSQNDGTLNGKKIEIKSARYWAGKDDCRWQHLEPDHDYEYALFVLLDFQGWKVWAIKKSTLMGELRDKKIVTFQGKQGWWTTKSAILSYLTPIKTIAELQAFVQ